MGFDKKRLPITDEEFERICVMIDTSESGSEPEAGELDDLGTEYLALKKVFEQKRKKQSCVVQLVDRSPVTIEDTTDKEKIRFWKFDEGPKASIARPYKVGYVESFEYEEVTFHGERKSFESKSFGTVDRAVYQAHYKETSPRTQTKSCGADSVIAAYRMKTQNAEIEIGRRELTPNAECIVRIDGEWKKASFISRDSKTKQYTVKRRK